MTGQSPISVRITRQFQASPARVFDAWLTPSLIQQWMFGARLREEEILSISVDERVGGKFSFLVRRQEHILDHNGTYLDLAPPFRLVFTWGVGKYAADESQVTVDITPSAYGCELTLVHRMDNKYAEYASRTEAGWNKMIGLLAEILSEIDQRSDGNEVVSL